MEKYYFVQPRQTGKTTLGIYEFIKNPEETLFVFHNVKQAKKLSGKIGGYKDNFISAGSFYNHCRGKKYKTIILDEFMFYEKKDKENIYKIITSVYNNSNIYVFTTSDKIYKKNIFDFVKENKINNSLEDLLKIYKEKNKHVFLSDLDQIEVLYYDFITDSDTKFIHRKMDFFSKFNPKLRDLSETKKIFGENDSFLNEIKGVFLL